MNKQEKEERREARREIARRVSALTADQRAELAARCRITTIEGHEISAFNACMILSQGGESVTVIGGYRQWQAVGRQVRKGETSFCIWCPTSRKKETPEEEEKLSFILGSVFDVSQTDEIGVEVPAVKTAASNIIPFHTVGSEA